jgi:uncharacterized membrane protein
MAASWSAAAYAMAGKASATLAAIPKAVLILIIVISPEEKSQKDPSQIAIKNCAVLKLPLALGFPELLLIPQRIDVTD